MSSKTAARGGGVRAPFVSRCVTTSSRELDDSKRGQKPVNTEAGGSTALKAVTRQLVNTQQTEKT
jgi:hypothetical protein